MARSIERPDKGALVDHGNRRSLEITYTVPLKDMWCPPPLYQKFTPVFPGFFIYIAHERNSLQETGAYTGFVPSWRGRGAQHFKKLSGGSTPVKAEFTHGYTLTPGWGASYYSE